MICGYQPKPSMIYECINCKNLEIVLKDDPIIDGRICKQCGGHSLPRQPITDDEFIAAIQTIFHYLYREDEKVGRISWGWGEYGDLLIKWINKDYPLKKEALEEWGR